MAHLAHQNKTQLVQENIDSPDDALPTFNRATEDRIPVVLVPDARLCCSCFYNVPSGALTIVHSCGDDAYEDLAPAGLHMCKPYWNHVAYMVTQQSCTYNAPVKSCPTKDNVMVDVEMTSVFRIGPGAEDIKNFVYLLGALKFNEFLAAETEEVIRELVRATPLAEVYELRGSSSERVENVLVLMNERFNGFGVHFSKAAVTDVVLNDELRRILQGTTEFKTKIRELDKEHDYNMNTIRYDYDQKLSERERVYDRRMQDIEAEINVSLVNRDKEKVQFESRREVNKTHAYESAAVDKKRAEADLHVVTIKAKDENAKLLARVKSDAEAKMIKIDKKCEVEIKEAEEFVKIADSEAVALKLMAAAEGEAAESLRIVRDHNLEMAKLEVTEAIARRARIVISGDNGEALVSSIVGKKDLAAHMHM